MGQIRLFNTEDRFGWLAIILHWLMALAIVGLFFLGLWMVELDYYHPWYQAGPDIHRSIGVLVFLLLIVRFVLRLLSPPPAPVAGLSRFETVAAHLAHWGLYLLMLLVPLCGYLISTADGRAVDVFGWFSIPATLTGIPQQEDVAGQLHYYSALLLVLLSSLHALAALKHHFIDRDQTLARMLGYRRCGARDREIVAERGKEEQR